MDSLRIQFLDENEVWQKMAFSLTNVDLEADARRYRISRFVASRQGE